jgi:type IV pilus assembly protein PilX
MWWGKWKIVIQHLRSQLSELLPALLSYSLRDEVSVASSQRGIVLVTGLIFLVILTLLGITALQSTILEEKMAGNLRDETLAFQAAEAALRSGEYFLEQVTIQEFNGENGLYYHACSNEAEGEDINESFLCSSTPDPIAEMNWDTDDSRAVDVTMERVASQPRYFIEQLPSVPLMGNEGSAQQSPSVLSSMFRIVARGTGGTETATVLLQSTYRR